MSKNISKKLSIMIFLHFFGAGSIIPILSLYLINYLHFSGYQVGVILATGAITSVVSPFISSFIADRIISSERLFGIAHFCVSISMFLLFRSSEFIEVFWIYLFYMVFFGPANPLSDAIVFHHISDRKKYGNIRVFGTIGWITAALFFGFFVMQKSGNLSYAFILSAFTSLFLSIYSFTIPTTGIIKSGKKQLFPIDSFKVIIKPQVLILILITFLIFFADRFYFLGISPYLKNIGFSEKFIMPYLSIGQLLEIGAMLSLGYFISKFRTKIILIVGISFNILRFSVLALFNTKIMTLFAIAFHGVAYTFIFSTIFIFIDYQTDKHSRAGAHQLFRIIYLGFGTFLGNITAGYVLDNFNINNNFKTFWWIPAIISTSVLIIMLFFPERKKNKN